VIKRFMNLLGFLYSNLSEVVFLIGLSLLSSGAFMIGTTVGVITTGVILVGLSFLLGGD